MHLKNLRIRGGLILGKENINIKYEHQNNSNYLVIEDNVEYDDYQYKMLRRNKPEHFLRFSMYSVNGRYGIYYDITSRQQLSKYYEYGKMTMEDVKSICVNISEMVRIAEDYMLDIDHVNGYSFNESLKILFEFILEHFDHSLDKESIVQLYEVYQKVIVGDYDPFNLMRMFGIKKVKKQEESVIQDMPEKRDKEIKTVIAEQMISDKEEKADESDVNIRRVIIGVVSMAFGLLGIFVPGLIPFRIPSVLSFICIGAGIGILVFCKKEHKKLQSVILTQKQSIPYVVKKDTAQVLYNESVNVNNKCIEEKTVSYDDICNETMLLSEYMPEKNSRKELKLVLQKENLIGEVLIYIRGVENEDMVICMDKYPYVIGSFEKMSDVVIKAQVVSRMHCCIYHEAFKDDEYLVEDLNATNGTYLNGERLGNHERKKLSDGDVLKIAAISFKVEIS